MFFTTRSTRSIGIAVAAMCLVLLCSAAGLSQDEVTPDISAMEFLEAGEARKQLVEKKLQSDQEDIESLSTPLNTLLGLRAALDTQDHEKAEQLLDRRFLPEDMEQYSGTELLRTLAYVFAHQNIINLAEISDHPQGDLDDGLPSYREQVGIVTLSSGNVPIYLQRVPDARGSKVWKLSNATVAEIPAMWDELGYSPIAEYLSENLPDIKFMGMDNWQLLATVLAFVIAWASAAWRWRSPPRRHWKISSAR